MHKTWDAFFLCINFKRWYKIVRKCDTIEILQALLHIPEVFPRESVGVIFGMAHHKEMAAVCTLDEENAGFVPFGDEFQLRDSENVLLPDFGVAGIGGSEYVIKAPEQGRAGFQHLVVINAEELFGQGALFHTIVIVQPGLGAPADVQGGMDMGFGPLHDRAQLVPIVHLAEIQVFHGSAGDDQTVVAFLPHLLEGSIEGIQMIAVCVLGTIACGLQQLYLNLKGRVGEFAQDLRLGHDLGGHQIQNQDIQGTDVLMHSAIFCHNKDVLTLQNCGGGQRVGNTNGHEKDLLLQRAGSGARSCFNSIYKGNILLRSVQPRKCRQLYAT